MDAGVMDGKRYILPLRYTYPILLALEDELQGAGLEVSDLSQNSEVFLSTVLSQEGNAWHVSGANVFAANLLNVFPSLCDYSTGEVSLDEETLAATLFPIYGAALLAWTGRALRRMVGFGPISYPLTARWTPSF